MDMQNDLIIPECGNLDEIIGRKVVVGAKQLRKAIASGRVRRAFFAENADPAITEPLAAMCRENGVSYGYVRSMAELGHACGIEVGAATAALVD